MNFIIKENGNWYHGSNQKFDVLETGSTITQWRELAEAFSHKPSLLCCEDDGSIWQNGTERGYLYLIDEPVTVGITVFQHPNSSMEQNLEFLTKKPLKVKCIAEIEL